MRLKTVLPVLLAGVVLVCAVLFTVYVAPVYYHEPVPGYEGLRLNMSPAQVERLLWNADTEPTTFFIWKSPYDARIEHRTSPRTGGQLVLTYKPLRGRTALCEVQETSTFPTQAEALAYAAESIKTFQTAWQSRDGFLLETIAKWVSGTPATHLRIDRSQSGSDAYIYVDGNAVTILCMADAFCR